MMMFLVLGGLLLLALVCCGLVVRGQIQKGPGPSRPSPRPRRGRSRSGCARPPFCCA